MSLEEAKAYAEVLKNEEHGQAKLVEGLDAAHPKFAEVISDLKKADASMPGGIPSYVSRARKLLLSAKEGVNPFEGCTVEVPTGVDLSLENGPGSAAFAECEKLGMQEIANCCFCLVAGGLGERLGYPGIKIGIVAEVTTNTTFMQLYAEHILALQDRARKATGKEDLTLPLAIMTSGDTHEKTVQLLTENKNFGMAEGQITLMMQEKVPALIDISANFACSDYALETKPHGHGDVHQLLFSTGTAQKWRDEGRKWVLFFQDTNPLPFRSFVAVVGASAREGFAMNSVAVPRVAGEAAGAICKLKQADGSALTINVEYNQLGPLLSGTPAGGDVPDATGFSPYPGNINVLLLSIPEYVAALAETKGVMPEFVNPKWAGEDKNAFKSATRLECMMQDFPRLLPSAAKVGFTQLDRWASFTCVKNNLEDARKKAEAGLPADCALSAEADIYNCNAELLRKCGADVAAPGPVEFLGVKAQVGPRVVLKPSFAVTLEEMKTKVTGAVSVSGKSTLVLAGDVSINGLTLDGTLAIDATNGKVELSGPSIVNEGWSLVPITPEAGTADFLKIRGYDTKRGEAKELKVAGGTETL
eukprot:CAMPEP_0204318502 /NCGR_PEP_ID=MMETSP0469-20131031/6570_1 /ASSEMBLY_ACC=CAM_ASM_000384 /TAXON_ID=2969 /ORGANISM="Oxyrrhis marina" /LENGTH=587 /DNA_ID=CAMNT_0051299563 /DNA_START=75 /DNA_END=1838 /DNA_ORIENTATION=+